MARKVQADGGGVPIKLVSRAVRLAVAGCAVAVTTPAFGLSLHDIEVKSHLGQRLMAEIPFVLGPGERLENSCLRLQSSASGLPQIRGIQFSIDYVRRVIRTTTARSLKEPLSSMTVQVSCPGVPNMVREYSIWLDLPAGSLAVPDSARLASAPSPQPAVTVPSTAVREVPRTPARPQATPLLNKGTIEAGSSYRVQIGDTLSGIAFRVKQREANTTWAWAQRIHVLNPGAFIGGNIDKLKAGSMLVIPGGLLEQPSLASRVASMPAVEARTAVEPAARRPAAATPAPIEAPAAVVDAPAQDSGETQRLAENEARAKLADIERKLSALEQTVETEAVDIGATAPISGVTGGDAGETRSLAEQQARAKLAEIERKLAALEQAVELEVGTERAAIEAAAEVPAEVPIYADEIAPPPQVEAESPPTEAPTAVAAAATAVGQQPSGSNAWITILAVLAGGVLAILFFIGLWRRTPRSQSIADILDTPADARTVRVDAPEFDSPPEEIEWQTKPRIDPSDSMSVAEITLPRDDTVEPEPEPEPALKPEPEPEPAPEPVYQATSQPDDGVDFGAVPISAQDLERILRKEEQGDDDGAETSDTAEMTREEASLDDTASVVAVDENLEDDTSHQETLEDDTPLMDVDETSAGDTSLLAAAVDETSADDTSLLAVAVDEALEDDTSHEEILADETSRIAIDESLLLEAEGKIDGGEDVAAQTGELPVDADLLEQSYIEEFEGTEELKAEFEKHRDAGADKDTEGEDPDDTLRDQKAVGK